MSQVLYGERSWNPLAQTVELTEERLRRGGRTIPLDELNLGAMAEAYLRGHWLGGGGAERALDRLAEGSGSVPLTRVTGTATPLKAREAAAFARAFGELAVRRCGGPGRVAALADRARAEGVPLWIARRFADGPAGPVAVAVDRRLVRVDVWGPHAPAVRVRAPRGFRSDARDPSKGLRLTVGEATAELVLRKKLRKAASAVEVRLPGAHWVLRRESATCSWLLRDGRRVALLARPPHRPARAPDTVLRPLSPVRHETDDPLDAVMAQAFAVTFGIGDTTGTARFRPERYTDGGGGEPVADDVSWDRPWFSNLGNGREDNESGGGDGWGADGGDGGDSGGGGDGGGGDGGGGGGD
ncbi:hypothetical protein AB0K64_01105 [Streptomyces sp. NPDC053741]|nr:MULTISPECIES: hypothetical protein [Streptomyces]MYT55656.1 hypothetical protein [Streptomyces sp. SID7834]RAS36409.1 hypothetical protein BCL80_101367 [Streptomyces avidinii]TPN27961.1 hypothetical protein FKO01_23125 [Mesorhizobium sp. B2-3-3]SNX72191.1 hypothetical protein SAMN05421860_101367 [Streptomyces microflavus]AGJ54952.1 hypothetical protein F750_2466 [Streptomyces sp. PAMC 26508]